MKRKPWILGAISLFVLTFQWTAINSALCGEEHFIAVDEYVERIPESAEVSVNRLADYLCKPLKNDTERARAIYAWIIRNVEFDPVTYNSRNYGDQSPQTILKTRKAVCGGFAQLFKALAQRAGLRAVVIEGFSRGKGYYPGVTFDRRDHAWNAVMLDGKWQLIDSIWGAGYVDAHNKFVREPCEHYFLTPPEYFIYDHFPQNADWQLINEPLSKNQYDRLVYVRPALFSNDIKLFSHKEGVINSSGNLAVQLDCPKDVLVKAEVRPRDTGAADASVFVQRENSLVTLDVAFSQPGDYILRVYAKPRNSEGLYDWVADYSVCVNSATSTSADFPMTCETFHERNAHLLAPMTGHLKLGSTEMFRIKAPGAIAVAVIVDGKWRILQRNGDIFEGEALVNGAAVQVAARFPGSQNYLVLLQYSVS